MSYKEELKKKLYGGTYPFFYCDSFFIEKLFSILDELNLRAICIKRGLIDYLLTEEEAKKILERLNN